jgi:hypothetical protein
MPAGKQAAHTARLAAMWQPEVTACRKPENTGNAENQRAQKGDD